MTAEKYVKEIARKLECGNRRKKEIERQLFADIQERVSSGETLDSVLQQMGSAGEVAQGFNEQISETEQKQAHRNRILKIVGVLCAVLIALLAIGYWFLPKAKPIEQSRLFSQEALETQSQRILEQFETGAYEQMGEHATKQMQAYLSAEYIDAAKAELGVNWGNRVQSGNYYMQEIVQQGQHMAIVQTTMVYENQAVTYTLIFDDQMRLGGFYMK
ncbi:MAG: DUF3887 domain-containing protein [Lachnospiraceae bacterium]|nr:DUF3887 domain-containing protein [Lachnospiraceae bacterium]